MGALITYQNQIKYFARGYKRGSKMEKTKEPQGPQYIVCFSSNASFIGLSIGFLASIKRERERERDLYLNHCKRKNHIENRN